MKIMTICVQFTGAINNHLFITYTPIIVTRLDISRNFVNNKSLWKIALNY
jgi:hypothetical protein